MGARDRRGWMLVAAASAAVLLVGEATHAQVNGAKGKAKGQATKPAPAEYDGPTPVAREVRVPVRPNDAVAVVNGEPITRQQLADEAVVRKGEEVLEAIISKKLIEQEIRKRKLEVTTREVDAEIDKIASSVAGVTREQWLSTLAKERKISPSQYANDIIYPGLALRKIAEPRVQVTEKDMKDAYEAYFGEKLKCRIIMTTDQRNAVAMWQELKKNPGGFAFMAQNDPRSIDQATKSMGGLLEQDLTRHAYPPEVSDRAFAQLVDGDPADKDPAHKPKNGDVTGPIQVNEAAWVILKRENMVPARIHDPKDEKMRTELREKIFEAKIKEEMSKVFQEIFEASTIENKLSGKMRVANEEKQLERESGGEANLMSQKAAQNNPKIVPVPTGTPKGSSAASSSVKPEDRATRDELLRTMNANPPR